MSRYLALALPSMVALSIGATMVIGWHLTGLLEPDELRLGVRVVCSFAWSITALVVLATKLEDWTRKL